MAANNGFALFYGRSLAPVGKASSRPRRLERPQKWSSPASATPGSSPAPARVENELQDGSIGRILYTRFPWRTIIPLDGSLLSRSSHLPACLDGPPYAVRRPHACLFDVAPDRGCRVSPCDAAARCRTARYGDGRICARAARPPRRLVSVALFLNRARRRGRTAVSRYPALWSPDLPRWIRIHRDRPTRLAVRILLHLPAPSPQRPRYPAAQTALRGSCDNTP